MAEPKIEPLAAIAAAIAEGLAGFKYSVKTGAGADLTDFLNEYATKVPAVFVSYHGFDADARYGSGKESGEGRERFVAYFIATKDIRNHINTFREYLRTDSNDRFRGESGKYYRICAERGAALRHNAKDVFELTIDIL